MKAITIHFEDKEFEELKRVKGKINWHDFVMRLIKIEKEAKGHGN